jgi:hypothetical protein
VAWATLVARPWFAVAVATIAAATLLLSGLGRPGLWEPQELDKADAALASVAASKGAASVAPGPLPPAASPTCLRQRPPDAAARSLQERAIQWTMRSGSASERGLRLPMAILGILTVFASAGIAARWAGARAALICAVIVMSFPLLVLQARQLTSELGTAAGATLLIYGLVSLRPIGASLWSILLRRRMQPWRTTLLHLLDNTLSVAAILVGAGLGYLGGGGLLGVAVPLLGFAASTAMGRDAMITAARLVHWAGLRARRGVSPRRFAGVAVDPCGDCIGDRTALWIGIKGLAATAAAAVLIYLIIGQTYQLGPLQPGTRQVFGHSIIATNCYSWALGGIWQSNDDLRILYDSSVEQIAFGTFPWGLMAPLAIASLLADVRRNRRIAASLCLAWAALAWVATESFQRKVGFAIYAGFPAMAIAVALWIDAQLSADRKGGTGGGALELRSAATNASGLLFGLFLILGSITLGKDLQTFPQRLTSLLIGNDEIPYPAAARWLWLPTRVWILLLGALIATAGAIWLWRSHASATASSGRRRGRTALSVALAATAALSGFWIYGWHASLSKLLSSKAVFASYHALRRPGDSLVLLGDLGNAPTYYADHPYRVVPDRSQLVAALAAPTRVFALAPASELCALHRQIADKPFFVLDNDNPRTLLLSNRVDGGTDRNPLSNSLYQREPAGITERPRSRIVFDDRIEIIGWNLPRTVSQGDRFEVTIFYKILAPVGGSWKVFQHYDRGAARILGDHVPISGRCPTSDWQTGDYIADRYVVATGTSGAGPGTYDLWTGFFTGAAPSWRNMPVTLAPGEQRDADDRVKIASIIVR